ncbi:MAG: hypothetical protein ACFFCY_02265 [Promethearchaeota archaeon]
MNFLEKLAITIVGNMSFYIVVGISGFYLGFALTNWFFFIILIAFFLIIIFWILIIDIKAGKFNVFKINPSLDERQNFFDNFSVFRFLKRFRFSNSLLLCIFILLLCIFSTLGSSIFIGTDPWMHISVIKFITDIHKLPINDYFGTFGFHIFSALIHFFSGMDIILIPRFFIFYALPIAALIIYNLFMRIFKNKSLAILGIYVLGFSSLGFLILMYQFWPSSLALIQGIALFFLLYIRLKSFTQEKEPQKKQIFSNLYITYFLFILIYISCILIHSLIAMIFLITFLWVYLIYFIKSYKRGFDFILLGICLCIFIIFYVLNISTGHLLIFMRLSTLPWYYILFGIIIIGILEGLILLHYRKSLDFNKGRFSLILTGKKIKIFKRIENKFLYPLIFTSALIITIAFGIINSYLFKFDFVAVITTFEIIIICAFAIWGLLVFQYKPRGKPLMLWGCAFAIILVTGVLFDFFTSTFTLSSRIFYLSSILISIGFVSYFYKLMKTKSIQSLRTKIFMISIVSFSLLATNYEINSSINFYSLKRREVSTIEWYSDFSINRNTVIGEFGWSSIIIYYKYPFEENNATLPLNSTLFFIPASNEYLNPNLHIQNNTNILVDLKEHSETDVYVILTDSYLLLSSLELFGHLTKEDMEMYYQLSYLNKICSTKTDDGIEVPLYWVI